ncbi:hypothetical protein SUGI_0070450 [Cryptomeria japonica]|nr:hypothetical protein SUGI_0070450 [Cryptomeria japonica]
MANIPRLTAGSSAEQVKYCEGLITQILSRVSTRDVLKMCTVVQRWRTMIFDPSFADTHYKNSQPESIFYFHEYNSVRGMVRETFQFRSYNPKTEHNLWTRERELDLSHEIHTSWNVSASSGVVWFTSGYNSVTLYHMGNRHWSTHRLDNALALQQRKNIECVSFEPTLLSF